MSTVLTVRRTRKAEPKVASGPNTVKKTAWFLGRFLCGDIDEDRLERMREHVSRCRGIKTRVRLSPEGWLASGSGGLMFRQKLKSVWMELQKIHDVMQDEKFVNVLLVVFALDNMPVGSQFELIAYKMRDSIEVRSIVDHFDLLTGRTVDGGGSVLNGRVGGGGSSIVRVVRAPSSVAAGGAAAGSNGHLLSMPGRPTNGSLAPDHWNEQRRGGGGPQRRYMTGSMGDLTGNGRVAMETSGGGGYRAGDDGRRLLSTSFDRRGWASENGSIAFFSETDTDLTNGIATTQINGRMYNGGTAVFDETDEVTSPVYLVYSRPPSERGGDVSYEPSFPRRRARYQSNGNDSVSLLQAHVARSRSVEPLNRYAMSVSGGDAPSDIYRTTGSGGVVKAKAVPYQAPTLVHPRFKKQYVARGSDINVPINGGGPVYRAASRSGGPSSLYGGSRAGYVR